MEYSLANLPPSIAHYAAQSHQHQQSHQNFVMPDKRTINRLKRIISFYGRLPKSEPFNDGTLNGYGKYPQPPQPKRTLKMADLDRIDDLPLFKDL